MNAIVYTSNAGSAARYAEMLSSKMGIHESSKWIVTGDSVLTTLVCKGTIEDASGKTVTIQDSNGNVLVQDESEWTITVEACEA